MAYLPVNARSECVAPSEPFGGGVVETIRMFHSAMPASHMPALRPMRGSGVGIVAEMIGAGGAGITAGIGSGGGGGGPAGAPPRPPPRPPGAPAAAGAPAAGGAPAGGAPAGGGVTAGGAAAGGGAGGGVGAGVVTAGGVPAAGGDEGADLGPQATPTNSATASPNEMRVDSLIGVTPSPRAAFPFVQSRPSDPRRCPTRIRRRRRPAPRPASRGGPRPS